jgi:hypothetical protein
MKEMAGTLSRIDPSAQVLGHPGASHFENVG